MIKTFTHPTVWLCFFLTCALSFQEAQADFQIAKHSPRQTRSGVIVGASRTPVIKKTAPNILTCTTMDCIEDAVTSSSQHCKELISSIEGKENLWAKPKGGFSSKPKKLQELDKSMSLETYKMYLQDLKKGSTRVGKELENKVKTWADTSPEGIKMLRTKVHEDLLFLARPGCGDPVGVIAKHLAQREETLGSAKKTTSQELKSANTKPPSGTETGEAIMRSMSR